MSLWRLEWLRLVRTQRFFVVLALFMILGFGAPLLERYLGELISSTSGDSGIRIEVPPPSSSDAIASYTKNAQQ